MDIQLPTKNTNITVKQESIPVPEGKTEKRALRSTHSKTFVHPEKIDGKDVHTCEVRMGAVCYISDDGELRSIDTTVRQIDDRIGIEWAPYKFYLHPTGIGFDFYSREGGFVRLTLIGIGGEEFNSKESHKPSIEDNIITFNEVRPNCDIIFKCLNERVKTLRILHNESAPRTFEWAVESDKPELIASTIIGTDAAGNQLELVSEVDEDVIREVWSGIAVVPLLGLAADVVYPVEIDPTVTVNPAAEADNGFQQYPSPYDYWATTSLYFGWYYNDRVSSGIRFPNVAISQGLEITNATLGLYATSVTGAGGAGIIYGVDVDNAAQFSVANGLPDEVTQTSASTVISTVGSTGQKSWDITAIAQEIFNRAGWASGNAMAFPILGTGGIFGGYFTQFATYQSGSNIPYVSITYAASGSIGPILENRLLLGRILGGSILC